MHVWKVVGTVPPLQKVGVRVPPGTPHVLCKIRHDCAAVYGVDLVQPGCNFPRNFTGTWYTTAEFDSDVIINNTHIYLKTKIDEYTYQESIFTCQQQRDSRYLVTAVTVGRWSVATFSINDSCSSVFQTYYFASSRWVHSLCLDFFVCHCLVCACMLYYCNMVRWAWWDW